MSRDTQGVSPIEPPADVPEIQRGNWLDLPAQDPVVQYVTANLWDRRKQPSAWEVARLSQAAYVYREKSTRWAIVAKFYVVKAGSSADEYAGRELQRTRQARAAGLSDGDVRAVRPLALWRGALFMEYIEGLTLEDIIAVRRSQPGRLTESLERAAEALSTLHTRGSHPDADPDFEPELDYAHKVIQQLTRYGVLESYPIACQGLRHLINRWATYTAMRDYVPALVHGDATTTNFIFPQHSGVVLVDWERIDVADPASDLGRLMAELTHSINQQGGSVAEAEPFVEHLIATYRQALPVDYDGDALIERARFYRASTTLRIARNGWVSRLDRTALVAQAMALLAYDL